MDYFSYVNKKNYKLSFLMLFVSIALSIGIVFLASLELLAELRNILLFFSGFLFVIFVPWHIAEVYKIYLLGKEAFKYFTRAFGVIVISAFLLRLSMSYLGDQNEEKFLILGFTFGALLGLLGINYLINYYKKG